MLRRARSEQGGFTLVELLVSISIGTVVMLALFNIIDQTLATSRTVSDRMEAQQRGRVVLERIAQQLRSALCVPSGLSNGALLSPIDAGDDNQVTYFTWVPTSSRDTTTPISMRQLVYDPTAKTLTLKTWTGWSTPPDPTTAPPDAGTGTQTLLTNVVANGQANPGTPAAFFGYYTTDGTSAMTTPLDASSVGDVDRVSVGFSVGPVKADPRTTADWASFSDDVGILLPPNYSSGIATGGPQCVI